MSRVLCGEIGGGSGRVPDGNLNLDLKILFIYMRIPTISDAQQDGAVSDVDSRRRRSVEQTECNARFTSACHRRSGRM